MDEPDDPAAGQGSAAYLVGSTDQSPDVSTSNHADENGNLTLRNPNACLEKLPKELLLEIFEHLNHDHDRATLASLSQTCKVLEPFANRRLYEEFHIGAQSRDGEITDAAKLFKIITWNRRPNLGRQRYRLQGFSKLKSVGIHVGAWEISPRNVLILTKILPRGLKKLTIQIEPTLENADRFFRALMALGEHGSLQSVEVDLDCYRVIPYKQLQLSTVKENLREANIVVQVTIYNSGMVHPLSAEDLRCLEEESESEQQIGIENELNLASW
jgi:hypothetical protein